jgi:hypothetical protein
VERDAAIGIQLAGGETIAADWVISAADGHASMTCSGAAVEKSDDRLRLLRARRERPCRRTAEQRDELAALWIELHAIPHDERRAAPQDIELPAISQQLVEQPASCSPMPSARAAPHRRLVVAALWWEGMAGRSRAAGTCPRL